MSTAATFMDAAKAAAVLYQKVDPARPLTVADAAAQSGLALRDAESGLKWLEHEYRGQLRVTSEGELVYVFPTRFTKPWQTREAGSRLLRAVGKTAGGVLRFVVRAWVTLVLVGYAALFLALLIGMTFAQQGNDSRSRRDGELPGGALAYVFLRVLGDALFWTFHPFSPFSVYYASPSSGMAEPGWGAPARRARKQGPMFASSADPLRGVRPKVPLYERVNRFFFGPPVPPEDPRESERLVLAAIRAGKGRIGLGDVMRVTGLPRDQADPMMARLMLDYEGDVDVSEEGGIVYRFEKLRKTAGDGAESEPPAAWTRTKPLPPLTGNPVGANLAIMALNAFNLAMGWWAIENGMTIERVAHLFDRVPYAIAQPQLDTGLPIALGVVPLVFSAFLFTLPLARAVLRPLRSRAAVDEKGRLAVLREVLERVRGKEPVTDAGVADAWKRATGAAPDAKRIDRELVRLGGDVAIEESGATRWRFADLETEAAAVQAEREAAPEEEARLGKLVYATDDN